MRAYPHLVDPQTGGGAAGVNSHAAATIRFAEILLEFSKNTFAWNLSTLISITFELILFTLPEVFIFFILKLIWLIKSQFSTTWFYSNF